MSTTQVFFPSHRHTKTTLTTTLEALTTLVHEESMPPRGRRSDGEEEEEEEATAKKNQEEEEASYTWTKWSVVASTSASKTRNPIREIMDDFDATPNPMKSVISCALGDPAVFGHLVPPPGVVERVKEMFEEKTNNGYAPSSGLHEARKSLARRYGPRMARKSFDVHRNSFSRGKNTFDDGDEKRAKNIQEMTNEDDTETKDDTNNNKNQPKKSVDGSAVVVYPNSRAKLSPRDTFLTHGCSQALSHAIQVLAKNADEEMAMLLPKPGFPLYQTLCEVHGVECVFYDLDGKNDWEIDLEHVKQLVKERKRDGMKRKISAILVNNPSNPCGTLFAERHLVDICQMCEKLKLPIIADEVYEDISFGDRCNYLPLASVSETVPILAVGSLSKRWLVPGWRLGWLLVHDRNDILKNGGIHDALEKLSQVTLGPPTPLQAALPFILQNDDSVWLNETLQTLREARDVCIERCERCQGLSMDSLPDGAMYALVKIDCERFGEAGLTDDVAFTSSLFSEESVLILPGQCFGAFGYARVVLTCPTKMLMEAWDRIEAFCQRKATRGSSSYTIVEGDVLSTSEFGRKTPMTAPPSDEDIDDVFSLEETMRREEAIY